MEQNNITNNLKAWDKLDRYSRWIYHMYEDYIGENVLDIGGGGRNCDKLLHRTCKTVDYDRII